MSCAFHHHKTLLVAMTRLPTIGLLVKVLHLMCRHNPLVLVDLPQAQRPGPHLHLEAMVRLPADQRPMEIRPNPVPINLMGTTHTARHP